MRPPILHGVCYATINLYRTDKDDIFSWKGEFVEYAMYTMIRFFVHNHQGVSICMHAFIEPPSLAEQEWSTEKDAAFG